MAVIFMSLFLTALIAISGSVAETIPNIPCDVNDVVPAMYVNFDDCSTFWQCKDGKITKESCPESDEADFALNRCLTKDPSNTDRLTCEKITKDKPKNIRRRSAIERSIFAY